MERNVSTSPSIFMGRSFSSVYGVLSSDKTMQISAGPYGQVSKELGTGSRAVANACRANPIPIIIPCHRVVAVHGLGGYMGAVGGEALQIKKWLLHHEGSF
jgi:O-6-methylguanine DNA methyltransferase